MKYQKQFLITTADERTWKSEKPILFLGEWCRLYKRKHLWQKMNARVAEPYGLDPSEKDADFIEIKKLEEILFPEICSLLNQHHKMKQNERFWSIVIGHWFQSVLKLLINRVKTIEQCFQKEEISHTNVFNSEYASLSVPDLESALMSFNDDQWNNVLYGRIIKLIYKSNVSVNFLSNEKNYIYQGLKFRAYTENNSLKNKITKYANQAYKKLSNKFIKNEDAFIINSYLPPIEEFKLEIALGQFPQRWKTLTTEINLKPNKKLRKKMEIKFQKKSDNKLENILRVLFFELLPVYYLEGLPNLYKIINLQPWPTSPKFIFTSNNFYRDEIFKLWTATKIVSGSKYYVGQHGNNYYTKKNMLQRIEEKTADAFITWGWSNGLPNYKPGFIFTTAGQKSSNYNPNGQLLLVETSQSLRLQTSDSAVEHIKYFDDQKKFLNFLSTNPKQKIIIRLNGLQNSRRFDEVARWHDFDKKLKIDLGKTAIKNLIKNSRLVVHSYDSTGILETLSNNIPTLAFWQNNFEHLCEKVKPKYQLLVDAGILHLSAESASNKVNEVWDDIDAWWKQNFIQETRKSFCNSFAKDCINPTKSMISILSTK